MFRNRTRELEYLDRRYLRPGAEFVVRYGRRRVGKSTLIYEWGKDKPMLYLFAARLPDHVLLSEFSQQIAQALGQPERTFADWTSAFTALAELAQEEGFITASPLSPRKYYPFKRELNTPISSSVKSVKTDDFTCGNLLYFHTFG